VHEAALQKHGLLQAPAPQAAAAPPPEEKASEAPGLRGLKRAEVAALIAEAMADNRIDLYLQPIVTLPQRKVRFYEAMARLRTQGGEIVAAEDFIPYAEGAGLLPALDNMMLFRCVAVTRRLQLKNREVGVICNIGAATLADPVEFKKLLQFAEANRALADALSFEFSQAAYRAFGPLEHEALAALAERGFRFSMDHIADLRMEPKELADRRFRFLKVPAALLLDKSASARSDIHPQDLADLLARSGIDVIADRVEHESTVVDLLDYDVRFGQGFLFSPPRPVRAEALQLVAGEAADAAAAAEAPPARAVAAR
jgi:cyclic-di-GMP phosphodiesterase, flagellum assembly factor TipF